MSTEEDTNASVIKPWDLVRSESGPDLPLFEVELRHMKNPRNQSLLKAVVLKCADTVNVVALTPAKALILVDQFRFGINEVISELPAGLIDDGEEPLEAAKRELLEETGYVADRWIYAGSSYLNPAYVNNKCHHYLALNAVRISDPKLDSTEDVSVRIINDFTAQGLFEQDVIIDAIGVAALSKIRSHLPPSQ
ncbi:MAG: NUDIX hydrolase [Saprospiraceae bacterium]|nr:NUDIX hydrolase [Saprospiraceae bacterium]